MNYEIKNNLLYLNGKQVAFKKTPNISSYKNKLQYLVLHYTATYGSASPISWLTNKVSQVSAHLVIDKDGSVTQLAPFDSVTWHAGVSSYKGLKNLNQYSIGIEIVNSGILTKRGVDYISTDGKIVTSYSRLKNKLGVEAIWENYTASQIEATVAISKLLQKHYNLKEIIGHEDISPKRKTDPGPAFPWIRFTEASEPQCDLVKTTTSALNLRKERSTSSAIIRVIPKGTKVVILEEKDGWSAVENGWVSSKYLQD